ncbi:hypothetical protein CHH27_24790 [Labrenzia sp. VG12]|nr:hypothetical protein CHH27_24790 [Labrenzia sp. VG12]
MPSRRRKRGRSERNAHGMDPMGEPWDDEETFERALFVRPEARRVLFVIPDAAQPRSGTQDAGEVEKGIAAAVEVSRVSAFAGMTIRGV